MAKRRERKKKKEGSAFWGSFLRGRKRRRRKPTGLAAVQRRRIPMPLTVQMAVFGNAAKHTMPRGKTAPHTHTAEKKKTALIQDPAIMSAS